MALKRWTATGATPQDPTVGANYSGGVAPANGDTIVVPPGTAPMTGGDLSLVDLALWHVMEGYTQDMGSSGARIRFASGEVKMEGSGTLWLRSEHATADIDLLTCNSPNKTEAVNVDDDGTADIIKIIVEAGHLKVGATNAPALAEVLVGYENSRSSDALFTAEDGVGTITRISANGGLVDTDAVITTAINNGARWTHRDGTIATLINTLGDFIYNSNDALTIALVLGGLLDFSQDGDAKTVTDLLALRPGLVDQGFGQVTFTNKPIVQSAAQMIGAASVDVTVS